MSPVIELTAAHIADQLAGELVGDGARPVRDVAPLDAAGPECLSWLGNPKLVGKLDRCQAAAVLVPRDLDWQGDLTLIRVDDPDVALCDVLRLLAPPVDRVEGIHPTAQVHPTAKVEGAGIGPHVTVGAHAAIGAGTQLHAGVHIGSHTRIGRDCVLWYNVVVREHCELGERVTIHPNATIGADGFGYLFRNGEHQRIPQIGRVVIEDDVEIGANSAIDRARSGVTRIGRGTKIDNLVMIGHNCEIGEHCIIVGQVGISGSCTLEHHVVLAGQVGVADHLRIGAGAKSAAQAGITKDVPPGAMVRGYPAQDMTTFARQQISVQRLPEMAKQVRELRKRVEELESTANDSK